MATATTQREQAKADRRAAIVREAARLFAEQGFAAVRLEDIGAAVGVSGPAVYRHFPSKQAILDELLVDVSAGLRRGGEAVRGTAAAPREQLASLVDFHVGFALDQPDTIRVQDRDIAELSDDALAAVRRDQRAYIAQWADTLGECSDADAAERRLRVRAVFGLLNSTPHSARTRQITRAGAAAALRDMALAALLA